MVVGNLAAPKAGESWNSQSGEALCLVQRKKAGLFDAGRESSLTTRDPQDKIGRLTLMDRIELIQKVKKKSQPCNIRL